MTKKSELERQEAKDYLLSLLKPGDTVYTKLNHCARSGMMRVIDLYVVRDGELLRITWSACRATGRAYNDRHEGMRLDGCGMDMGFKAVYSLGYALWPHGTPEPHGRRNGEPDSDGGYALKHRWL